jgi:glycosyltransferase involved in cell wall biosynthesis
MSLVSVIIPNYNYARFLSKAINSVLAQTYPNIEIIVVDDGSTDNSLAILARYEDRVQVLAQANQGVARARNNGVARSSGEYLAFLDADDLWLPAKIEKQVELFEKNTALGLVHVGIEDRDVEGNLLATKLVGMEGWVAPELLRFQKPVILGGGSGFMIRRANFAETGGFDPRLSTSADWEFLYRVTSRYEVGFIKEVLMVYRIHGSNMHGNVAAMGHDVKIGLEKAFEDRSPKVQKMRRECYGNFHYMMAGSYFRANNYPPFFGHAVKSLWYQPQNIANYLRFHFKASKNS